VPLKPRQPNSGVVEPKKAVAIRAFFRHKDVMTFSSDELILALVSLVRATRPGMLRQEADGFSVDFEAIARGKAPGDADRLRSPSWSFCRLGPRTSWT
jgi:hypothetical protein